MTEPERDVYGAGGEVALLEKEVAELLGKPAAVFLPTGVMAQQAVLRTYADRSGSKRIAMHGLAHPLVHELNALEEVHGLRPERMTTELRQPRPDELAAIPGKLAAVMLELPLRDAGFVLPSWDELIVFAEACAERDVPLHLDGARLWESTPYFGHDLAEVAALATTVYVSFYKGLGGMAGAALAGPEDIVQEVRRWQRRLGGNLFTLLPYAVSAREGLRTVLPKMGEFHQRAVELAEALVNKGFRVFPERPHCNSFRLFAPIPPPSGARWRPADVPGWSWTEVVVTSSTLQRSVSETVADFAELLDG
ncbi:threonine aldolase family protein [Kribbella deserti]|uniref:Threonine aldolase family protein n=1 Tax=Kribbella deserti TaxID=1926257 RepID=A0ABV6QUY0_9ACTN